jgi:hypothetical protein
MSLVEDLRERVYRIRALLHLYEECLTKPVSELELYAAKNELRVTKVELLTLLMETKKKVNQLARDITRNNT